EGEGGAGAPPPPPGGPPSQIPLDLKGAIEAHYNPDALGGEPGYRAQPPYRGAPPPETTGPNQPAGFGMQEPNGPQGNLELPQPPPARPGPTPPVPATAQLNLPLRRQAR